VFSRLFLLDPIISVVGSDRLFQAYGHADELQSILVELDVRFFETIDLFKDYMESTDERQRHIVFTQHAFEQREQMTQIPFTEQDTHVNDLIYRIFNEMKKTKTVETQIDAALATVSEILCPSGT
jgi:hypothetical protein